ncbi:GspE/PulE family protein [Parasedimentitalea huanghaiensis]|uniref:AAA+ ATPase domain-containing protein n=1 Tax=Parasedimentitalea huanghaiensis TaxID=2682100 RepID=A0A6L6WMC2_9RHOB|nr:GspE/PulE family protein [Zongyanglinia huanghaiensis]MVO18470.1 hypothetical protein [Zongyanglinia huanghaiensis]
MISSTTTNQDLADLLLANELLSEVDVERGLSVTISEAITLDRALLKLGLIEEDTLLPHVAELAGLRYVVDISDYRLDTTRLGLLSPNYCSSNALAPVLAPQGPPLILLSKPCDKAIQDELNFHLDGGVIFAVTSARVVRTMLSASQGGDDHALTSDQQRQIDQQAARSDESDGPVIRFVSSMFDDAVALGASDIHFEAQEDGLRIRFRVHGLLKSQLVDRGLDAKSILARVKVMASMNVSERRLPQDGRITLNLAGRKIDFRVSSVPTAYGESIVARVLDPKALRLGWAQLGFNGEITQQIKSVIEQPSGLFLVTGPTGSGKTTTLYTALSHLNRDDRKILTIEDPVEYNLPGIEQVQVHEEIGMTFAKALRAFLRQDPNVIMIGEIRDQETAEIACRAALVGRMVLSTLHTNSPQGAVTRLVDLGVPEYIVRDVLRGVLGQTLEVSGRDRRLRSQFVSGES